jgi:uncharacterized protein
VTLYHLSHIDLDGYGCQCVTYYFFQKRRYYNSNYGVEILVRIEEILHDIHENNDQESLLLVSDLNLSPEEAHFIHDRILTEQDNGRKITLRLLDHHGSGAKSAECYDWYYLDTSRCATKIVFDFMIEHYPLPSKKILEWLQPLVSTINAIDIWLEDDPEFEFGKVLMRMINDTREINRYMFVDEHRDYKIWMLQQSKQYMFKPNREIRYDEAMHRLKKQYLRNGAENDTLDNLSANFVVKLLEAKKERCTIWYGSHRGMLVFAMGSASTLGNHFLKCYPEFDFFMDVSSSGRVSMRANGNIDVADMSRHLMGGGGHPNASGGKISNFKETFLYAEVKSLVEKLIDEKGIHGWT